MFMARSMQRKQSVKGMRSHGSSQKEKITNKLFLLNGQFLVKWPCFTIKPLRLRELVYIKGHKASIKT
jgi:hypothetical protein